MLTYIFLPGLFFLSIYLVARWDKMAQKKIDKVELDEIEKSIS